MIVLRTFRGASHETETSATTSDGNCSVMNATSGDPGRVMLRPDVRTDVGNSPSR